MSFKKDFLDKYLKFGLGSMPKSDVDALGMHLIDVYGAGGRLSQRAFISGAE